MRTGDRATLTGCPGVWRIHKIERTWIHLTGTDEFAKLFASLSPYGIVLVRRQELAKPELGDTLL